MSDKASGFMSAVFVGFALAGFAVAVASAWAHEPVGVIYGLFAIVAFAICSVKMWKAKA
jgi:hypothetical protein